ncbi:VOC family protein [Heyndrickxia sp. NPDC080065]|uniref:VOC family protein n=1 Tax=Heyndrickxia sp. NPDC080065 TaxID=3390568 RepID=UPI003D02E77D
MSNFISHIATVEIPVTNLNKSIEFYIDILGVEVEFKGDKAAMLTFSAKGVPTLYLVETEEHKSISFINTNNGIEHSVIDFYTPNLNEFYNWLIDKEIEVGTLNVNNENGLGGFGFKDPDGNLLSACNILQQNQ